jgi:hypothetical protein
MRMPDEHDELDDFDGIDISGPWGGVRIGSRAGRRGGSGGNGEYRRARRRVRQRLDFFRHVVTFAIVVGGLALLDWATGGGWWVQWVAMIWGGILALQLFSTFVSPALWGRDVEERMVQREMERRRGRVSVLPPDDMSPPHDERDPG